MRSGTPPEKKSSSSKSSGKSSASTPSPKEAPTKELKGNEHPVFRKEDEKMEDTETLFTTIFHNQLSKLRSSRRSSLSTPTSGSSSVNEYGQWQCYWGTKSTSGAANDNGLLNLGRIIGMVFVIEPAIKRNKLIKENLHYRWDWDKIKGKHFNTVELFAEEKTTRESSPRFTNNVEKAYVYTKQVEYVFFKNIPDPTPEEKIIIDEYINNGRAEVNEGITTLTNRELRKGAIMPCGVAREFLRAFDSSHEMFKTYFETLKGSLRPLINSARQGYLQNNVYPLIDRDEYNSHKLNVDVLNIVLKHWKDDIRIILSKINSSTLSTPSDDGDVMSLVSAHSKVDGAIPIFLNELEHALHGSFARDILLQHMIDMFDKIKTMHESTVLNFFDILSDTNPYDKENILVFKRLVLDVSYRNQELPKLKGVDEPKFQSTKLDAKQSDNLDEESNDEVKPSASNRPHF